MTFPFRLKPEDDVPSAAPRPLDDDRAPVLAAGDERIAAPRKVRSQLVALDGRILTLQDIVEDLYSLVRDPNARKLLGALHGGLEEAHETIQRTAQTVERG